MQTDLSRFLIFRGQAVAASEFVSFWFDRYHDPHEKLYTDNIGKPLTADRVWKLYEWKAGQAHIKAARLRTSIENCYVNRAQETQCLDDSTTPQSFLDRFDKGGAIWRIFWLHCWRPERYPIFDQHVWRARQFLGRGVIEELGGRTDKLKVELYLEDYLPWWNRQHFKDCNPVQTDRALWACGKFLKTWPMAF